MSFSKRIGFIQGRLLPLINDKIQAFPEENWKEEFIKASSIGINLIELTVDSHNFSKNPISNMEGNQELIILKDKYNLSIPSITCDCFMQKTLWSMSSEVKDQIENLMNNLIQGSISVGNKILVWPLVDNGRINNNDEFQILESFISEYIPILRKNNISIAFESDFEPSRLLEFINNFPRDVIGINYDIGNSACYGFNPAQEIGLYGDRIINVHVKDRKKGGTTVPLGNGNAKFELVFKLLSELKYKGNFILQTARASRNHVEVLEEYAKLVDGWINKFYC